MDILVEPGSCQGEILVVDDAVMNLTLLAKLLRRQGYQVRCATNGQMALRAARLCLPDLMMVDISMPGMDGYELCRQLKTDPITQAVPVIFVSALDALSASKQAYAVGGADYIAKPYQIQDVLNSVERVLKSAQVSKQSVNLVG
jgi:CheY-like chemotaxis protein